MVKAAKSLAPVFFDANIVLDVIIPGRPRATLARRALTANTPAAISTLTVHPIGHFGRQAGLDLGTIQLIVSDLRLLALDEAAVAWAFANCRGDDFEDALQLGVAVVAGCGKFVTADKNLAKTYTGHIPMKIVLI